MAFDYKNTPVLSKIDLGGKIYWLKDAEARTFIDQLAQGLADVQALKHIGYTDIYADDIAIKAAIEAGDQAIKDYVNAQVGSINKFDVKVLTDGAALPEASADTMYILYLKPETDAASGSYVEYITVRSGEEDAYTYSWEAIGSTKMDVTGFVTEDALNDALEAHTTAADAKYEAKENLKGLAYKDSASGTIEIPIQQCQPGHINEYRGATDTEIDVVGATVTCAPAGSVTGNVTATGSVTGTVAVSGSVAAPTITVTPQTAEVKHIETVGTLPVYQEGSYTAPSATSGSISHLVASETVDDETLSFATKTETVLTAFDAGQYTAPVYTAGTLPTIGEAKTVVTGITSATSTAPVFTGDVVDINALFAGNEVNIKATFEGETTTHNVTGGKVTAVQAANIQAGQVEVTTKCVESTTTKTITVQ